MEVGNFSGRLLEKRALLCNYVKLKLTNSIVL